jgi:hypothetical protein
MPVAQSIRHSKASVKVVNQKSEGAGFIRAYRMLGNDWSEAPDEEVRSQKTGKLGLPRASYSEMREAPWSAAAKLPP